MDMGEPLSAIRKVARIRKTSLPPDSIVTVVQRLHAAYGFRPEAYRFVGIGDDVLRGAGVLDDGRKASAGPGVAHGSKKRSRVA
jgi:hypothetical protein